MTDEQRADPRVMKPAEPLERALQREAWFRALAALFVQEAGGMEDLMTHASDGAATQRHPAAGRYPAPRAGMAALRLLSISHRTAPLDQLERMALSTQAVSGLYGTLHERGLEAVVVATCNRTELYWETRGEQGDAEIERLLFEACGLPEDSSVRAHFEHRTGRAAAEHLFRVACGLESLVLGEGEVLGQVRNAIDQADQVGTSGFFLAGLFRAALRCGGRARQETGIGNGALSVASASVQMLVRVLEDLEGATVLVIGAGATGLKAARHLKAERVGCVVLLNRTLARAEEAAAEIGCEAAPLEALADWVGRADAIMTAAQVESPLVTDELLRANLPAHRERPLVLVDLSLPRAISPSCGTIPGVVHHDLSGLEQIVALNRARREREIPRVTALVERELGVFETQARESAVRPLVAELRQFAESIRRTEIERSLIDGPADAEALERVTRRIVDRLLHGPSMALRRGDLALDGQHAHYLRLMFGLDEGGHGAR